MNVKKEKYKKNNELTINYKEEIKKLKKKIILNKIL